MSPLEVTVVETDVEFLLAFFIGFAFAAYALYGEESDENSKHRKRSLRHPILEDVFSMVVWGGLILVTVLWTAGWPLPDRQSILFGSVMKGYALVVPWFFLKHIVLALKQKARKKKKPN